MSHAVVTTTTLLTIVCVLFLHLIFVDFDRFYAGWAVTKVFPFWNAELIDCINFY